MAEIINSNYETVTATCSACGVVCIFNRIDDLRDTSAISGRHVVCGKCGEPFWINGDRINPAWRFLLDDAEEHFAVKRYMPAIASAAQAWEVFFSASAFSTYVYRPFFAGDQREQRPETYNTLAKVLITATSKFTFYPLRNLVIRMLLDQAEPTTVPEALRRLEMVANMGGDPSGELLDEARQSPVAAQVAGLLALTIGALRNNVIHKHAYRPRRAEVNVCLTSEVDLMYQIKQRLGVGEFIEHQFGLAFRVQ